MALNCDYCGHKSNEIKSGSGISDKGKKIELRITDPSDLSRDILKVSQWVRAIGHMMCTLFTLHIKTVLASTVCKMLLQFQCEHYRNYELRLQ